jgi:O-acetyl-ADP-ribose deacetylase (regulator of RNase III)
MIQIVNGNLLDAGTDGITVLAHQCNCQRGFGSGIAGEFRKRMPWVYEAFAYDSRQPHDKLGTYCKAVNPNLNETIQTVYNLYGQFDFGGQPGVVYTKYTALESALSLMLEDCKDAEKIGLPYLIGCGLANGSWDTVYKIILDVSNSYGKDIFLYKLN